MILKKAPVFLVILILCSQSVIFILGQSPGDYHLKFWGGGLHVWLSYPEEASPGDELGIEINIVSGKFPRGNQVEEVKAKITVLTDTSSVILYDNTLIQNIYMPNGNTFTQSIPVTLPNNARWFVTIQMDTISYQQDMSNRQEAHVTLDATQVKESTYLDLETQVQELQAYNTQLGQQIYQLQSQLDSIQDLGDDPDLLNEYIELQNTFNELFELHEANIEYIEGFEAQMADIMEAKDARIEELDVRVAELIEENQELAAEFDAILSEYEDYRAANVTNNEFEPEPEVEVVTDYTSRNIFIVTTILASAIAIAVYVRNR